MTDKGYFFSVQQMKKILKSKEKNKQIILKILMLAIPVSMKDEISKQKPFFSQL